MKRYYYIYMLLLSLFCTGLAACTNELTDDYEGPTVNFRLNLSLPAVSRVAGDYEDAGPGLDYTTDKELYMAEDDVYVLIFDKDKKLYLVPDLIVSGTQGEATRTLTAQLPKSEEEYFLRVAVNLAQNGCYEKTTPQDVKTALREKIGIISESALLSELTFNYPDDIWKIETADGVTRYLPMSGVSTETFTLNEDKVINEYNLYRSVAKMEVKVDEAFQTDFKLNEVRVLNMNNTGYFISSITPDNAVEKQYELPDVNANWSQRTPPLSYRAADENGVSSISGIYVTESDNINAEAKQKPPLQLMVIGTLKGQTGTYYIDMIDDKDENNVFKPYDIIRNHSYIFNITAVTGKKLTVTVEDYVDVPMKGINSQYILDVDKNLLRFPGAYVDSMEINITTDGTPWKLVPNYEKDENGDYKENNDWFQIFNDVDLQSSNPNRGKLTIAPEAYIYEKEHSQPRTGYFYVKAGKILKRITVIQDPIETANCYIVTRPGTYALHGNVKGNGNNVGLTAGGGEIDIDFDSETPKGALATNHREIVKFGIIWETIDGLVTVDNNRFNSISQCVPYTVHPDKTDQWGNNIFASNTSLNNGYGGNALIGGYDEHGVLKWSWHIWVIPDYDKGVKTETWVTKADSGVNVNGYQMMDRYLGAYSNQPGTRSYGLLYQWGRKDPFIGPDRGKDSNKGNTEDYGDVKQAYTRHYTLYGNTYRWKIRPEDAVTETVAHTIQNPTTLMRYGVLAGETGNTPYNKYTHSTNTTDYTVEEIKTGSGTYPTNVAKSMWGTGDGTIYTRDNGVKTMWDPSPAGFRVPSIHTFIFEVDHNGSKYNSYIHDGNYGLNNWFVPDNGGFVWPLYKRSADFGSANVPFHSDAPFYGFWLKYDTHSMTNNFSTTKRPVIGYGQTNQGKLTTEANAMKFTWLPIGGVYNGSATKFGACGEVEAEKAYTAGGNRKPASSIHVNSIIWLNAPMMNLDNNPAGVFLHGTEGHRENGTDEHSAYNSIAGRHIHSLSDITPRLRALPHYAGNIRCVRDKNTHVADKNTVSVGELTLNSTNDYSQTVTVHSDERWWVSSPGARWVTVSPDKGKAGDTKLTISCAAPGASADLGPVYVVIRYADGTEQKIKVERN